MSGETIITIVGNLTDAPAPASRGTYQQPGNDPWANGGAMNRDEPAY